MVRGSMTSAEMFCFASVLAAISACCTIEEVATSVISLPVCRISASPKLIKYSSSGTSALSLYINLSSKITTGLLSRIAVFINPFAS